MALVEQVNLEVLLRWHVEIDRRLEALGLTLWEMRVPHMRIPRHLHEFAYFCVLLDGEFENDYGNLTLPYHPAINVYHPAGTLHSSVVGPRGAHVLTLEASTGWIDRAEAYGRLPAGPSALGREDGAWPARRLLREIRHATPCSLLAIEGLALELLAAAARCPRAAGDAPAWLERAHDLVRSEFTSSLTVREIADRLGAEPARLSAAFRKRYGQSLGDYVRGLRVKMVCEQLGSEAPLADIALAAGFADQAHCTRVFKRLVGVTPGSYRATVVAQRGSSVAVRALASSATPPGGGAGDAAAARSSPSRRSRGVRQRPSAAAHSSL